jgi:protein involved in polysaccharide export with SLBB domain
VTGLVVAPQGVYLRPQSTLRTVIAQVGGLRREAKNAIKIYRRKPDSPTAFEEIAVNYGDILKQKTPDILLQPYDVIEVGEASQLKGKRLVDTLLGFAVGGAGQVVTGGIQRTVLY